MSTPTLSANERLGLAPTDPRPDAETKPAQDRRETNPLLNDQPMKLGLFGINCSGGLIMSHAPSSFEITWEHQKSIARQADELGFEALVPVARWKGFGGSTNFNGNCFETYTWAAGISEATQSDRRRLDLAPADLAPDRRREGRHHHRPDLPRTVRAEPGDGLGAAGNGDVRRRTAPARRAVRVRPGVG